MRHQGFGDVDLTRQGGSVQRGITRLRRLRVRAAINEVERHVFVELDDRRDERRHPVRRSVVDWGFGGQKNLHGFEVARHRRMQERRESAFGTRRLVIAFLGKLIDVDRLALVKHLRLALLVDAFLPPHLPLRGVPIAATLAGDDGAGVHVGARIH